MVSYNDSQSVHILLRFWNEPIRIVILLLIKRVGRRLLSNIALAVIVHFDKVLIIRRKKESPGIPYLLWAFPGGKVEAGESFGQAVIREAAEEIGLKVTVNSLICERIFPGTNHTIQYFQCQLCEGCDSTVIPKEDEIAEWKWVTGLEALNHFTSDVAETIAEFLKQL